MNSLSSDGGQTAVGPVASGHAEVRASVADVASDAACASHARCRVRTPSEAGFALYLYGHMTFDPGEIDQDLADEIELGAKIGELLAKGAAALAGQDDAVAFRPPTEGGRDEQTLR